MGKGCALNQWFRVSPRRTELSQPLRHDDFGAHNLMQSYRLYHDHSLARQVYKQKIYRGDLTIKRRIHK